MNVVRKHKEPPSVLLDIEGDLRCLSAIEHMADGLRLGSYGGTAARDIKGNLDRAISACKQAARDSQREELLCANALQTGIGRRAYAEKHGDTASMLLENLSTTLLAMAEGKISARGACSEVAFTLRKAKKQFDEEAEQNG